MFCAPHQHLTSVLKFAAMASVRRPIAGLVYVYSPSHLTSVLKFAAMANVRRPIAGLVYVYSPSTPHLNVEVCGHGQREEADSGVGVRVLPIYQRSETVTITKLPWSTHEHRDY